ncbi:hypothetical protein JYP52_21135 [Nitratireductor aquibiodomus]|uniref:hypothetical protein n=1 Tax=Nitratireductor aquibiodomus TaxID=204799 RepID=UPI0019D3FD35|nr:hypothetical protein [Nitratireductor aquibiodomus]MBN7763648.1 hypothetical protein [Nitratireductor aquibiodomus]
MPVRSRRSKRRQGAGVGAWFDVFEGKFDFFGELEAAGVDLDRNGKPDLEVARTAWAELGEAFMEEFHARYPDGAHFTPWAVEQFGAPPQRKRRLQRR